jgi:hypothetical protein
MSADPDEVCGGCGSTLADRQFNQPDAPQMILPCPHCGSDKCCMCDLGDDVECGNCRDAEE